MASYTQEKYCSKCKKNVSADKRDLCKICGTKIRRGQWTVRFRHIEDGVERHMKLRGQTRREAEAAYIFFLKEHPREKKAKKVDNELTLHELIDLYLDNLKNNAKGSSYNTIANKIKNHIRPAFDSKTLANKIKSSQLQEWQNTLNDKGYAYCYKTDLRSIFTSIFDFGKFYDIDVNPFQKVKPFKNVEGKKEMLFWTEKEFQKFISEVDDLKYKTLFSFLYIAGTRIGEALALQWKDINFCAGTVKICKTISKDKNDEGENKITSPKTINSTREISLSKNIINMLNKLQDELKASDSDFVFGGSKPLPANTVRKRFSRYIANAGVNRIRIHDLRHSSVSYMINHATNHISAIFEIAKRIGDNVEQIYKTYGHLFPSDNSQLVEKFDDLKMDF